MQNFEPSHEICPFPQIFYIFTEFCRIQYRQVITGQILHIWSTSGGFRQLLTAYGKFAVVSHGIWQTAGGIWKNLPQKTGRY